MRKITYRTKASLLMAEAVDHLSRGDSNHDVLAFACITKAADTIKAITMIEKPAKKLDKRVSL